jgi:hypothetical protein
MKILNVILLVALTLNCCTSNSANKSNSNISSKNKIIQKTSDNNDKTINDLITFFKLNGFEITKIEKEDSYTTYGASDGYSFFINGSSVVIYKYDITEKGQKTILDKVEKDGLLTAFGMSFPVQTNGCFVIHDYQEHPEKKKILEVFHKF